MIFKFGKKIYTKNDRIILIKKICDKCKIEYDIHDNYIEIFILTIRELKYKKDIFFEGSMYSSYYNKKYIYTKIGKYALFI